MGSKPPKIDPTPPTPPPATRGVQGGPKNPNDRPPSAGLGRSMLRINRRAGNPSLNIPQN